MEMVLWLWLWFSACASSFPKYASDFALSVPNGSYAITASHCVQCSCGPGSRKWVEELLCNMFQLWLPWFICSLTILLSVLPQFVLHASFVGSFVFKYAMQKQQSDARECYGATDLWGMQCDLMRLWRLCQ